MKTQAQLYSTSGFYPDTEENREKGIVAEPWPVPVMSDREFVEVILSMRLKAFPLGGHQKDAIFRNGRQLL